MLAGALCRILKEDGYKTAPFKSQNMALNSYITKEGLEMGRAQVMQAEAAGIEPSADMNPILLKPTNDTGSQIIVRGRPFGMMSASEYYKRKKEFIPSIMESYRKLDETYDVIVIEGAGSPAEINLKKDDIVNMGFAKMADAPVLLVGDIDRGGVFAQLAGTMLLLEEEEKKRVKGTIINKFRGDVSILKPGLRMLEEKINTSVLGVIPYFHLDIEDEDSLTERFRKKSRSGLAKIAVIRLPRISNFTDIAPLEAVDELDVSYVSNISQFGDPDVVIIPGSKNTISDLLWMRQNGLEGKILRHAAKGGIVFGICGGYQMLGQSISDPTGAEQKGTVRGMGLLPVTTVFEQEKRRTRVSGRFAKVGGALAEMSGVCYEGYEIHMGRTVLSKGTVPLVYMEEEGEQRQDGAQSDHVYGCYMHGIFDMSETVKTFLAAVLRKKGIDPSKITVRDRNAYKEEQYDRLASIVRENLNMEAVYKIIRERKRSVMQSVIRIGSRESRLAVKQAEIIKDQIRRCDQTILVEIITMKTTGDKILDRSLESVGGKGLFVKELDQALADGRIDLAVHSLKDMPMEESSEFPILAYSRREDPRDVLIYKSEKKEQGTEEGSILTKTGAVIGTSSKRRMIQIQKLYPNAVFQGIRGNIQTRLSKLNKEEYDAAVLAAAGVKRLNMEAVIGRYFSVDEVIPAAGQGILAVQGRKEFLKDTVWRQYVDDKKSRVQALAERSFIRVLDGGCTSPSAAYAKVKGNELELTGLYYNEKSGQSFGKRQLLILKTLQVSEKDLP